MSEIITKPLKDVSPADFADLIKAIRDRPPPSAASQPAPSAPSPATALVCSKCPGSSFKTFSEFRAHCKSDWHVSNLKRVFEGLPVQEEGVDGELSDGSSSSSSIPEAPGNFFIWNSMPWVQVNPKFAVPKVFADWVSAATHPPPCPPSTTVLLLRSGRFAAAIFNPDGTCLKHTAFQRYTCRKKQGGSQSAYDSSGKPARSAGAAIRRLQERKMVEDLENLICSPEWSCGFSPESFILVQVSKSQKSNLMVGPLEKAQVYKIPMTIQTPSYAEATRVFETLMRVRTG